ncbi:MAG: CoA transferase [Acidimicrobiia bacterium]|nr:CoA transferase [Acidimicrobiia bacterium]
MGQPARPARRGGSRVEGIFEGIRVLDFTNAVSGPTLTRLMAEMGADVIKVELPPTGDLGRTVPGVRNGRSGFFVQQNRGKRSLFLDVKAPEGRELAEELVRHVDVLVENFSPGVISRLGFDWETVSGVNPRLVMCSISAFGQEGPLRDQPGYDAIAQAYSGVMSMNGDPTSTPALIGLSPGDVLTGVHGLAGVVAALHHRERTGTGQKVEVSLIDCYMTCHELNIEVWSASGGSIEPTRAGSLHPLVPAYGVFGTADGDVMIAVGNDRQWAQLCRAMGRPELAEDERYATAPERAARRDELNELVAAWTACQASRDVALARLQAERVPVAPVLSVVEAASHPHVRQRGTVRTVDDELMGPLDIPGVPLRFSSFPDVSELRAASLGSHNREVVCGLLGWSDERYEALVEAGVLLDRPIS